MNPNRDNWQQTILPLSSTIGDAVSNLNSTGIKIVLIVKENGVLAGTISDGDIRRSLLKGLNLGSPITSIVHRDALVVLPGLSRDLVKQLMTINKIQQIPIVDDSFRIIGLHLWDQFVGPPIRSNLMVIMAGGMGIRLRPHTENCPKPLLQISGKPILEHIIERAKADGFESFLISIHYLGHMIEDYFGDGSRLSVHIEYLKEDMPLGTAGALGLLMSEKPVSPFLVTNGDVITDVRYGELLDFHVRQNAIATMAVHSYEWQHPFGVVHTNGIDIVGFEEKPITRSYVNAGVYAINPEALEMLEYKEHCDMPTLFERLSSKALRIVAYPMHEPWLDIGRPDDLLLAIKNNAK